MINRADSDRIYKYFADCISENIYVDEGSLFHWLQSEGLAEKPKIDKEYLSIQLRILNEGLGNKTDDEIRNFLSTLVKIAE